jgi:hypothetical protein
MFLRICGVVLVLFVFSSCGSCLTGPKDAGQALDDQSSIDVLKRAAEDKYEAPRDGKLSEEQVLMYLKVQNRAHELRKVAKERFEEQAGKAEAAEQGGKKLTSIWEGMKSLSKVGDLLTVDIRAAQELGHNTAEYEWVKNQVLEASFSHWYSDAAASLQQQSLDNMKKARAEAADSNLSSFFDQQISVLEQSIKEEEERAAEEAKDKPGLRHNVQLLQKHRVELDALKTLLAE